MILCAAAVVLTAAGCEKEWDKSQWPEIPRRPDAVPNTGNYQFSDGVMSEEVLHNYLSRAITQTEFLSGPETSTDGVYGTETMNGCCSTSVPNSSGVRCTSGIRRAIS